MPRRATTSKSARSRAASRKCSRPTKTTGRGSAVDQNTLIRLIFILILVCLLVNGILVYDNRADSKAFADRILCCLRLAYHTPHAGKSMSWLEGVFPTKRILRNQLVQVLRLCLNIRGTVTTIDCTSKEIRECLTPSDNDASNFQITDLLKRDLHRRPRSDSLTHELVYLAL